MPARLFPAPALADSRVHLERRLLAMTENNQGRAGGWGAALVLALGLLGAFACGTEAPTAATVQDLDVSEFKARAEQSGLLATRSDGKAPLYMVDGRVVPEAAAREIAPEDIASIQVLKGEVATGPYGIKAANGVVHVITRKEVAAKTKEQLAFVAESVLFRQQEALGVASKQAGATVVQRKEAAASGVVIRKAEAGAPGAAGVASGELRLRSEAPLFVVDGDVKPASFSLESLSKESIERIEVLKAAAAVSRYGERGVNGVIIITTKGGGR